MKFAKELEDDLVPEWRVKYFNYKQGKKKIKAVSRALKNVNRTPGRPAPQNAKSFDELPFTHYDFNRRNDNPQTKNRDIPKENGTNRPPPQERRESLTMFAKSPPVLMPVNEEQEQHVSQPESPASSDDERRPLQRRDAQGGKLQRYGSIVGTPPDSPGGIPELELPDPALDPRKRKPPTTRSDSLRGGRVSKPVEPSSDAYHVGPQNRPQAPRSLSNLPKHLFNKHKGVGTPTHQPSKLRQIFTSRPLDSPTVPDVQLDAYRELDVRQDEFFNFLDKELEKIEKFYKSKEEEANHRLNVLREQLHEMRDQRLKDIETAKRGGRVADKSFLDGQLAIMSSSQEQIHKHGDGVGNRMLEVGREIVKAGGRIGKTSKVMEELSSPKGPTGKAPANDGNNDYIKKNTKQEHVPYRFAKARLKLALQEFYRGLELLKSYALLNRTAFRKLNKKYDKAVNARPTLQYMAAKVNDAHFVKSTVVEGHLVAVEDLYARYFERGHHKIAVSKLRSKMRQGDHSSTAFRNGIFVAAGACFGIAGLVNGAEHLFSDDPVRHTQASYLLQIYAGYFLALLLFMLYVLDCRIWQRARVNYIFVFEFDTRHVLDWRQLAEFPCFFLFLNGLFLWLNFQFDNANSMYLYWPVILLGVTLLLIFLPLKILYYHSRYWFAYSNWRLLLAGLYPVEFRDFFFGDMYCSETYTLSQIALFFCLYANSWDNPARCNSNHSMLLGFFTTLPAIWRALQCLRRYYDTRNWFPHLANFAKYLCNILYYMTLSLYRLKINPERHAVFIVFALINGVYCSIWDVLMDWSLGNPYARHPFLRDNLAYRRVWVYYAAIVLDVLLRQQWVFYAIFSHDLQHSAVMSFLVGLAEVLRRGMWSLFRVENEHCNNVVKFRASRDVPLPYHLPLSETSVSDMKKDSKKSGKKKDKKHDDDLSSDEDGSVMSPTPANPAAAGSGVGTAVDLERAKTNSSNTTGGSSVRQRKPATPGMSALRRVGTVIAAAHAQDFQKKKRPEVGAAPETEHKSSSGNGSSDEEDDDDEDDVDRASIVSAVDANGHDLSVSKTRQDGSSKHQHSNGHSYGTPQFDAGADPTSSRRADIDSEDEALSPRHTGGRSSPSINIETSSHDSAAEADEADIHEVRERIGRARSPAG